MVVVDGYPWFKISFRGGRTGYKWGGILCSTGTERPDLYKTCAPASEAVSGVKLLEQSVKRAAVNGTGVAASLRASSTNRRKRSAAGEEEDEVPHRAVPDRNVAWRQRLGGGAERHHFCGGSAGRRPRSPALPMPSGSSATMSARNAGASRPSIVAEPEKLRRLGRGDSAARRQRHAEQRARSCAPRSPCRAPTPASVPSPRVQRPSRTVDLLAVELEAAPRAADRRHGVGHQHRPARAAQRQAQHRRRDMLAVDDHAVPGARRLPAPPRSGRDRGCRAAAWR